MVLLFLRWIFHKSATQNVLAGLWLFMSANISFTSAVRFKISVLLNLLKMLIEVVMILVLNCFYCFNDL